MKRDNREEYLKNQNFMMKEMEREFSLFDKTLLVFEEEKPNKEW